MTRSTFKKLYAIANPLYRLYCKVLAKRLVRRLLKMEVAKRREYLLSNQFIMIAYCTKDGTETRVYRHRSGIKITDKITKYTEAA